MSRFVWGTVTGVSPLRVQLDGDTTPMPFTPDSLVDPLWLSVTNRVRCEVSGRRLVILGRSGGAPVDLVGLAADVAALGTWTTFTPTWGNLTVGNGTLACRYTVIGEGSNPLVVANYWLQFGSTTSISGNVTATLPVDIGVTTGAVLLFAGVAQDASPADHCPLLVERNDNSSVSVRAEDASGTYVKRAVLSASIPFTWTTSDVLKFSVLYRGVI